MNKNITIKTTIDDVEGELIQISETLSTFAKILRKVETIDSRYELEMQITDIHSIGRVIQHAADTIAQLSDYVHYLQEPAAPNIQEVTQ